MEFGGRPGQGGEFFIFTSVMVVVKLYLSGSRR